MLNKLIQNRFSFLFVMLFSFASSLFAQKTPSMIEPTIDLPPILLELEDSMIERLDTPLPKVALPEMGEIDIGLPEVERPEVDLSKLLPDDQALAIERNDQKEGHFIDFTLGTGSLANVMGKLGWHYVNDSGLSVRFNVGHNSSLFWNYLPFEEKGMARNEETSLDIDYLGGDFREMFDFEFDENQLWSQNKLSEMDSLTWRNLLVMNRSEHFLEEDLSIVTSLAAESHLFSNNYGDATRNKSFLMPSLGLALDREDLQFLMNFDYRLSGELSPHAIANKIPTEHFVKLYMDFLVPLPYQLKLGGGIGVAWSDDSLENVYKHDLFGVTLPFAIKFMGNPVDWFDFSIEGGFKEWTEDYQALQKEVRWMDFSNLKMGQGWYFDGLFEFPIQKMATLSAGIEYEKNHRLNFIDEKSLISGLIKLNQQLGETLHLSAGVQVTPHDCVEVGLSWRGEVLSPLALATPEHELDFSLDYKIPQEWFGGKINLGFDYYETARIPRWDMSWFFEIEDNYQIHIVASDLLAGIYGKQGRPGRGIFMEEGSRLALLFQMSL